MSHSNGNSNSPPARSFEEHQARMRASLLTADDLDALQAAGLPIPRNQEEKLSLLSAWTWLLAAQEEFSWRDERSVVEFVQAAMALPRLAEKWKRGLDAQTVNVEEQQLLNAVMRLEKSALKQVGERHE